MLTTVLASTLGEGGWLLKGAVGSLSHLWDRRWRARVLPLVEVVFHPNTGTLQLKTEKHLCIIDVLICANARVFVK